MHFKKGDNVVVIAGKDKGKTGKIAKVLRDAHKVVIEGLNLTKRRERPRKEGQKGQTVSVAMPIHASNVMLVSPKSGARTRIRRIEEKGVSKRVSVKDGSGI